METFVDSGYMMMVVIGFVIIEMIAIVIMRRASAIGIIIGIVPGLCLMLALLVALQGGRWQVIVFWVTLSLPFHLIDLRYRLRG
jgi:hypothetical protein